MLKSSSRVTNEHVDRDMHAAVARGNGREDSNCSTLQTPSNEAIKGPARSKSSSGRNEAHTLNGDGEQW